MPFSKHDAGSRVAVFRVPFQRVGSGSRIRYLTTRFSVAWTDGGRVCVRPLALLPIYCMVDCIETVFAALPIGGRYCRCLRMVAGEVRLGLSIPRVG